MHDAGPGILNRENHIVDALPFNTTAGLMDSNHSFSEGLKDKANYDRVILQRAGQKMLEELEPYRRDSGMIPEGDVFRAIRKILIEGDTPCTATR